MTSHTKGNMRTKNEQYVEQGYPSPQCRVRRLHSIVGIVLYEKNVVVPGLPTTARLLAFDSAYK